MPIEYEATFLEVDKNVIRIKLQSVGAILIKPEFLQKRMVFKLPTGHEIKGGWLRVRDEGDKITMSLKIVDGDKIENQKEVCLKVDSFETAISFLESIGCERKAYQENRRELWGINGTEVTIDEWPFLEPYVEVEAKTEEEVISVSKLLGFDYSKALFCSADTIYSLKYGVPLDDINNKTSKIVFDMDNPFKK